MVLRNMFDGLVVRDPDMNIRPELAESWRVVDDKTVEFKLRKGVTFTTERSLMRRMSSSRSNGL